MFNIHEEVKKIIMEFSVLQEVEGILLSGSHATGTNDKDSDYDIYIYTSKEIPVGKRKDILHKYCSYMELNNTFWETEDDCYLKENNIPLEIIFRNLNWIEGTLNRTLFKCQAEVGYTTCFWSNFINSLVLYDRNGELKKLQERYSISYPENLKENIVKKNYPLLKLQMPAYYYQLEKALKRDDVISVNHRVTALFASYFDIIFAINEMPHPGEKKILKILKENKAKVPENMEINVNNIIKYASMKDSTILLEINELVYNLDKLVKHEGIGKQEILSK